MMQNHTRKNWSNEKLWLCKMKERDRYLKIVEWSEEDRCYVGAVPGWIGKCCHGEDEIKVYRELCSIVDEWIAIYKKEGRPLPPPTNKKYSGKFVLRTGPDLHRVLVAHALNEGESLNNFIIKTLQKAVL
jgi:predicted HicB family RNase H-like nuclease